MWSVARISIVALFLIGCARQPSSFELLVPPVYRSHPGVLGHFNAEQVVALKAKIRGVAYPRPASFSATLLGEKIVPVPVGVVDWHADKENKGRVGGNIVDYWLNRESVMQVATAYYSVEGNHFSLEQWCDVLEGAEITNHARQVYPY